MNEGRNGQRGAHAAFAFLLCGLVPLLPFVFGLSNPFPISVATTLLVFFLIGSAKSRWLVISWWRAGLETLAIGGIAALLAYAAGVVIGRVTM